MHDRNNKKTNVTSQMNVVEKHHVANVNAVNALKAHVDVLCVSCDKNVLIPCHDKCFAKYKLSVNAKVRRDLFTTPRTTKSKSVDTTPVVAKTSTLSNYMRTEVHTSRKWQKWFEIQPKFSWSPKCVIAKMTSRVTKGRDNAASHSKTSVTVKKWVAKPSTLPFVFSSYVAVIQLVLWIVDSGCSKHMTGNLKILRNFIEKFMGRVRFGNDHFSVITVYGDYVQGNLTICHVYYVEGLRHNLFSVGQFCDGDLEVAFRSNTCYVLNLEGEDFLSGSHDSNLYTISISDMATLSPVLLMSKATSTKSWLCHQILSHLNFGTINHLTKQDLVDRLPKF
ncbi:integrase, catalytic region, zinc finger, CCHC-type containing protein [Tanacetum coccineum]